MSYFKNVSKPREKRSIESILEETARNAREYVKDLIIEEVNAGVSGKNYYKSVRIDGVRYKRAIPGYLAAAVIDYSTPKNVSIPPYITIDGERFEITMVYIRKSVRLNAVIDISDNDFDVRFEGDASRCTLRANRLAKDLTCRCSSGLIKFDNLILKAPEFCNKKTENDIMYVTDIRTDNVVEVPIKDIDAFAAQSREVYSGTIETTTILLKDDSSFPLDGGLIHVYEDLKTVFSKVPKPKKTK